MQHFRRTLPTILILTVVVASLVSYPLAATASPSRAGRESMPPAALPATTLDNPNSGEPDSGSTRSTAADPAQDRFSRVIHAQSRAQLLRLYRWTTFVWAKRILGAGE
jgi:hypothetical protein